jgi:TonB family protein
MVVGGGEVLLETTIDQQGRVAALRPLRTSPPFADLLADAVRGWRFAPAEALVPKEAGRVDSGTLWTAVESKVLIAGVFRAPTLNAPVLGELPRDVAPASDEVAAPLATAEPPYPPGALNGGVVLLEAQIGPDGAVGEIAVLQSAPPFDEPARTALRAWKFRPARVPGVPVATFVYVLFSFPPPITQSPVK